jgi:hypothetical protein
MMMLKPMAGFNPSEIIGRTYLGALEEDGQQFRTRIVKAIVDHNDDIHKYLDKTKFLVSVNNDAYEEIVSYNEIVEHIQRNNDKEEADKNQFIKFCDIWAHQGPLQV